MTSAAVNGSAAEIAVHRDGDATASMHREDNVPPAGLDLWVLAGQSNMAGRGVLADALIKHIPRVWNFSSSGRWEVAQDPLHKPWESFTSIEQTLMDAMPAQDRKFEEQHRMEIGAGLGLPFARRLAATSRAPIGLIPAAFGGTSLTQWDPRGKTEGSRSLYGAMLERIDVALRSTRGNLRGILWYQGESDTTPELATTYKSRFLEWVDAVRHDLGFDVPIAIVQLGRLVLPTRLAPGRPPLHERGPAWDTVRRAQLAAVGMRPDLGIVSAIDLGLTDEIHIDSAGLSRLGRRLARLALGHPSPNPLRIEHAGIGPQALPYLRLVCENVSGAWSTEHRIPGFTLCDSQGLPNPDAVILEARIDTNDPTSVVLLLSGPANDIHIAYGLGLNPTCILVDQADMPLPAFMLPLAP